MKKTITIFAITLGLILFLPLTLFFQIVESSYEAANLYDYEDVPYLIKPCNCKIPTNNDYTFGWRIGLSGNREFHYGTDFGCSIGSNVYAVSAGVITGVYTDIHGNTTITLKVKPYLVYKYLHHRKSLVQKGDSVFQGQVIAECGKTGQTSGPHVHLEMKLHGKRVDVIPYLKRPKPTIPEEVVEDAAQ